MEITVVPKQWTPNQDKKFARDVRLGQTYFVVVQLETRRAPFEDPEMYREYVFTERFRLTGTPRTDGGMTATELCRNWGPVFDTRPTHLRRCGDPSPQVSGPLGSNDYEGILDEAELRGLEKHVRNGSHPHSRRPANSWRP
ncbi:hypothetical protein [Streptomyces sp. SID10815]|uniref:hypothetical protein n=1 Tax=Streptomyces sp. SID10815 TaxID=2706027 RepID=UPI0013C93AC9|nr:hypothetical protein [Streptomyces sp. SID10815]NEA52399.1 hypothetical protein [Streptomyces sp. SID10815]